MSQPLMSCFAQLMEDSCGPAVQQKGLGFWGWRVGFGGFRRFISGVHAAET